MDPVRPERPVIPVRPNHAPTAQVPGGATERVEAAHERERERNQAKKRSRDKKEVEKGEEAPPEGPLGKKVDIRA